MSFSFDTAPIAAKLGIPASAIAVEQVLHEVDGKAYENVLIYDRRSPVGTPAVLSVPNFFGISQVAAEISVTTIGPGKAILLADVFGKDVRPATADEAAAVIAPLKKDRNELRKRMAAALQALVSQKHVQIAAGKIGACGFCFGGTAALELARSGADLVGTVSLHAALDTPNPQDAAHIRGAILALHGVKDPSVPRDQLNAFMDEMSAQNLDWQLVCYGEAGHSFTDPNASNPGFYYHERTAKRAAIALQQFFAHRFN